MNNQPTTTTQHEDKYTNTEDLAAIKRQLKYLHNLQHDFVIKPNQVTFDSSMNMIVTATDVKDVPFGSEFAPDKYASGQIASRFDIPVSYMRTMEEKNKALAAENVNSWLDYETGKGGKARSFLIRAYRNENDPDSGRMRAFLSDQFKIMDNLPLFEAVVNTIAEVAQGERMNVRPVVQSLSDSGSMFLRFINTDIEMKTFATRHYRNPLTGEGLGGGVVTGFVVRNNERGGGKLVIAPRVFITTCSNGAVYANEAFSVTHLGAKLENGLISWNDEVRQKNIDLIIAQIRQSVKRFLSPDFLGRKIREIEAAASIELNNPVHALKNICGDLGFSDADTDASINWLMSGSTQVKKHAFDLVQAVTFQAQQVNPDRQWDLETKAAELISTAHKYDERIAVPVNVLA